MLLFVGDKLGRYEIVSPIGKARNRRLQRFVAGAACLALVAVWVIHFRQAPGGAAGDGGGELAGGGAAVAYR